eukprot:12898312-Prorocentrum_lima.AAC.1
MSGQGKLRWTWLPSTWTFRVSLVGDPVNMCVQLQWHLALPSPSREWHSKYMVVLLHWQCMAMQGVGAGML